MPTASMPNGAASSEPMRLVFAGLHVTDATQARDRHGAQRRALLRSAQRRARPASARQSIVVDRPTLDADITREGGMLQRVLAEDRLELAGRVRRPADRAAAGRAQLPFAAGPARHGRGGATRRVSLRDVPSGIVWVAPDAQAQPEARRGGRHHLGQRPLHWRASRRADRRPAVAAPMPATAAASRVEAAHRRHEALDAGRPVARRGHPARRRHCAVRPPADRGQRPGRGPHRRHGSHRRRRHHHAAGRPAGPPQGPLGQRAGACRRRFAHRADRPHRRRSRRGRRSR